VFTYNAGFAWDEPISGGGTIGVVPKGSARHGSQVPTSNIGIGSNLAAGLFCGPRFKADYRRDNDKLGCLRMVDVVPTLCKALGIEPPRQSQGAVAYDFLKE
jgi:hypothetical protein